VDKLEEQVEKKKKRGGVGEKSSGIKREERKR